RPLLDTSERGRALARPRTANGRARRRLAARAPLRGIACVNDVLHALALVLELRAREGLPGALRDLLRLAVERDLRQVGLSLDVDQDAHGLDRAGGCRDLLARGRERLRGEDIRDGSVRI